jgi:hypothetical protein
MIRACLRQPAVRHSTYQSTRPESSSAHGALQQQRIALSVGTVGLSQIGVTHWSTLTGPFAPYEVHAFGSDAA